MPGAQVFITTPPERRDIFAEVRAWWDRAPTRLVIIDPPIDMPRRDIDRWRRIEAARLNDGPAHFVADDDILPIGEPDAWVAAALSCLDRHPCCAMLSAWLVNEPLGKQVAAGPDPSPEIMTELDVGGLRLVRSGLVDSWPEPDSPSGSYDRQHCDMLRALGWHVGYMRDLRATHLGRGRSLIWAT
jgi:hypothetical protein